MEAFRAADKSYEMIYLPVGKTISVNTSNIEAPINCWWFNPRDGKAQPINISEKKPVMEFTPPSKGIQNDWVLVIDEKSKGFKAPGSE